MLLEEYIEPFFCNISLLLFKLNKNKEYICYFIDNNFKKSYPKKELNYTIEYYLGDFGVKNNTFNKNEKQKLYTNLFLDTNKTLILMSLKLKSDLYLGILFPELCNDIIHQLNKSKTDFISNISHEFRTPLNGIIGMTQNLKDTNLTKDQLFCINNIEKCNYDLLTLVNDILDYSKLDNGSLELDIKSFSLKDCLESAININLSKMQSSGINVEYTIDSNIPSFIIGDPQRLKQVLINLINNSLKFTKKGEVKINVTILEQFEPDYTQLKFDIIDTGIGIPDDMKSKLFRPFVQAKNGYNQGTGLGLVICKHIIKLMDGDIKIEHTEVNKGTTVSFNIKIKKSHETSTPIDDNIIKGKYILIVDDNEINRLSLMQSCYKWGMIPIMCSNSNEAIACCDKFDFYCGLIDIVMPEHSGIWLASKLIYEYKINYPLIGLSSLKEINKEAENLFLHFLLKPVKEEIIFELLININKDNQYCTNGLVCNKSNTCNNIKVLIVDDTYLNRKIIETFIIKYGINEHNIKFAENGKDAINFIKNEEFNIVFLDIKMPEISGIEVYDYIKEHSLKRNTKFIVMTAYIIEKENIYITKYKFDNFIYKPIDYSKLVKIMDSYCK